MTKFSTERLASLDAPVLTGDARAITASPGDSDTTVATTAFVQAALAALSGFTTGDAKITFKTVADPGWVMMDDGTIGDASSGATTRAHADTQALFILLWTNVLAVSVSPGGRGASALADFNAHSTIMLPKSLGRSLAVAGAGSGLTNRALGSWWGAETETPTLAKTASHAHTETGHQHGTGHGQMLIDAGSTYTALVLTAASVTLMSNLGTANISNNGSGTALNILDPSVYLNVMIKL